jgi:hypothetical protein
MDQPNISRRRTLTRLIQAVLLSAAPWPALRARAEPPHLTAANPTAASLGYTEDSAAVDAHKFPQHDAAQRCANCKYFQGSGGSGYAPCALYPGNEVNASGWCAGYVAR